MKEVLFSGHGGLGVILENESESDFIKPESVFVADTTFNPGDMTDFHGMFIKPIRFAGTLIRDDPNSLKQMCFHTGDENDLFGIKRYYYCFMKVSDNRIFTMYSPGAGRDYNWINGEWK